MSIALLTMPLLLAIILCASSSDAFLLSHRKLLVPFVSMSRAARHQHRHHNLAKDTNLAKTTENNENLAKISEEDNNLDKMSDKKEDPAKIAEDNRNLAKNFENHAKIQNLGKKKPKVHSRRKRMHHFSMLRKIGDPRDQANAINVSNLRHFVQRYRNMTTKRRRDQ